MWAGDSHGQTTMKKGGKEAEAEAAKNATSSSSSSSLDATAAGLAAKRPSIKGPGESRDKSLQLLHSVGSDITREIMKVC